MSSCVMAARNIGEKFIVSTISLCDGVGKYPICIQMGYLPTPSQRLKLVLGDITTDILQYAAGLLCNLQ